MTEIFFVRHSEPRYNNDPSQTGELTEKGRHDCFHVTKFLEDRFIDAVVSSPYVRSADTLRDFAEKHDMNIRIIDDLRERKVGGEWMEDFEGFCHRQWLDFDFRNPDGENLSEVQKRNMNVLNHLIDKYKNKRIAVGSHSTALSLIINHYIPSFGFEDFLKIRKHMPCIVRFAFISKKCQAIELYTFSENDDDSIFTERLL